MKVLGRIIFYGILIIVILLSRNVVIEVVTERFRFEGEIDPPKSNQYALPKNASSFVSDNYTEDFLAKSYDDLRKIIFTTVNSGTRQFTFYCAEEYEECFIDLERVTDDKKTLTYINSFVHPFNAYHHLSLEYDSQRKIVLNVTRLYSSNEIENINQAVNRMWAKVIKTEMSTREKIKAIHDEILNNSSYDRKRADSIMKDADYYDTTNVSHKASGPLLNGMAICGGYSDAMSLFLYKMGIPNYRVSNDQHIWNLVNIDNQWLHLDLTWNNPTTSDNQSVIITTYFLITSNQLKNVGDGAHIYDENIFIEAK